MSAITLSDAVASLESRSPPAADTQPAAQPERPSVSWPEDEFWRQRRRANAKRRRASLLMAVPLVALFGLVDGYIAPDAKAQLWLIRYGVFTPVILVLLVATVVQPLHRWSELGVMLGVVVAGGCVTAMTLISPPHYAGILLVVIATYTFLGLRCLHASGAGIAVSLLYVVAAVVDGSTQWPLLVGNVFFLASCNVMGVLMCLARERAALGAFSHTRALSRQRRLSERLLRNVLPVAIARRLKSHSGTIADAHSDVTILFADIVDFTSYAAAVAPARLVQLLDQVFTCFDRLAQTHGLDKIKTIGDAYMVAGGLRTRGLDHVRAAAEMALDMLDAIGTFDPGDGRRLALRVGIHSGPVVAGVIGRTKYAYDLWGDTVNVASRLEGLTLPGTIQVSESTYERLRDDYAFSPRQLIAVKGRGEMPCYLLLARSTAAPGSRGSAIPMQSSRPTGNAVGPTFALSSGASPA